MDQFDDGNAAGLGPAMVPTLAGVALLVIAAIAGPRLVPQQSMALLVGGGAVAGLALWGLALLAGARRATMPWKLASLLVLLAAGIGAGLIAHGQYQTRARSDARSFAELEIGPSGKPQLAAGTASRGPISRAYAVSVQADAEAQRAYDGALARAGVGNLNSPYLLGRDPAAIRDCGVLAGVQAIARENARGRAARRYDLLAAIDRASLPNAAKRGIVAIAAAGDGDPLLANQLATLDATRDLCVLLARRGWFDDGGVFGFRSEADRTAYHALRTRLQALAEEGDAVAKAERARIEAGREQVRDALSRSIYADG